MRLDVRFPIGGMFTIFGAIYYTTLGKVWLAAQGKTAESCKIENAGKSTLLRSSCGCPSLAHSPYGPYRVVSALASTTAELRAACS